MFGNYFLLANGEINYNPAALPLSQFLSSFNNLYQLIDPTNTNNVSLNAGNISQVSDVSGNNMHILQATATKQPLYSIGGLNGKNAIYFDGVNDCLTTANYSDGAFTKWYVWDMLTPAGFIEEIGSSYLWTNIGATAEISRNGGFTNFNNTASWGLGKRIVCWRFDGTFAGHQLWVNGVLTRTSTGPSNPGTTPIVATLNLGSRNNGASGPSKGFLAHRSAYSRSLSNTEIANIFTRLNTEFNIY